MDKLVRGGFSASFLMSAEFDDVIAIESGPYVSVADRPGASRLYELKGLRESARMNMQVLDWWGRKRVLPRGYTRCILVTERMRAAYGELRLVLRSDGLELEPGTDACFGVDGEGERAEKRDAAGAKFRAGAAMEGEYEFKGVSAKGRLGASSGGSRGPSGSG
ncbi:hypothetical protein HDU77_008589 [Chytriomyces hyalinus]|nr:hypothetical protein HDU77_008589 [Chytriomyces hyalinus]